MALMTLMTLMTIPIAARTYDTNLKDQARDT